MAQSTNLKPCPFCGAEIKTQRSVFDGRTYYGCENRNCPLPVAFTLEEWNARPIEDALQARIDRAKDLLQEELGEWLSVSAVYLPDHFLQLRQVLDVLEGGGE